VNGAPRQLSSTCCAGWLPAQVPRDAQRQRRQPPAVVIAVGLVAAHDTVGIGVDIVEAQSPAAQRRREVRQHHGQRRVCGRCAGNGLGARDAAHLDLAQPIAGRIETQHRKIGVLRGCGGGVEVRVAVGVVDIGVAEQDVEQDGPGALEFQVLEEFAQHLARPGPSAIVARHGGETRLVDVHYDDVRIRLRHDDPVADHRVEGSLAHLGAELRHHRIERQDYREYRREVEVEAIAPMSRDPCRLAFEGGAETCGKSGHGAGRLPSRMVCRKKSAQCSADERRWRAGSPLNGR